jgi:hypothetical protein
LAPRSLPRRLIRHPWTDEELNLISYLKLYHNWTWIRIRRTYFPSVSKSAISNAYTRISNEDRVYRASLVASLAHNNPTTDTTSAADITYREILARASASRRAPSPYHASNRYNLRPDRPQNFQELGRPLHQVDHTRFHHFYRTCEDLSRSRTELDEDYVPPSRSPTPDLSDRSPSVVSSQPSDASSSELFGLEVRPVNTPEPRSSIASSPSSEGSSSEFFSVEEHLSPL